MKVITFSRIYPSYHPKAGQPTGFVEKIWEGGIEAINTELLKDEWANFFFEREGRVPKVHTIRAGERWKVGDYFSPRVWSQKAYRSPQIQFADPIRVEKVWPISVINRSFYLHGSPLKTCALEKMATNDGLSFEDLLAWFNPVGKKPVPDWHGQIICWNKDVEY